MDEIILSKEQKESGVNFQLLSRIAEGILVNDDLTKTSDAILKNLNSNLDVYGSGICFPDESGQFLQLFSYTNTKTIDFFIRFIRPTLFQIKFPIANPDLLLSTCFRENRITRSDQIRDFFAPFLPGAAMDFIQRTAKLQECLAIPIRVMGKPTGVLFAVFRQKLTATENSLFQFYANLSGLALDNHLKLSQMKRQVEMEKTTTSVLSHELKTPIAIAHNSVAMLQFSLEKLKDLVPAAKMQEIAARVGEVQADLDRILRISNSIFILREVEAQVPLDTHVLDLQTQLQAIVDNFQRIAKKNGLILTAEIIASDPRYKGGVVQLEQIITILLDNAIKYTKKGRVDLRVELVDGKLRAIVTDTGEGIPDSERSKIFDQYYRRHNGLARKTEGLGLGLYIAKKIVDKLDGHIFVENNPAEKGTRFTVELPAFLR